MLAPTASAASDLPGTAACRIRPYRNCTVLSLLSPVDRLPAARAHSCLCSNEVQIHCRRPSVLWPTWKPTSPSVLRKQGGLAGLVQVTRHQHQSVDGVEILPLIGRIENLPGHLDHDRAGIADAACSLPPGNRLSTRRFLCSVVRLCSAGCAPECTRTSTCSSECRRSHNCLAGRSQVRS